MFVALIAATVLMADAASAAPTTPPPAAPAAQPAKKAEGQQMVCKSEQVIGSRLPVKKCMTKGEADMRRFEDRQDLERSQGDTYRR